MADRSKIEWTDASWNPIRARYVPPEQLEGGQEAWLGWHCTHVSEGCRNCYAEAINKRRGTGFTYKPGNEPDIEIFLDEQMLLQPLRWKRPRKIFVGSMSDIGAHFVTDEMLDNIFAVAALTPQHTFQILTKRPERMRTYFTQDDGFGRWGYIEHHARRIARDRGLEIPSEKTLATFGAKNMPNVWLGTSVEDQATADERIPHLLATPAAVRFLSCEPLLGSLNVKEALRPRQPLQDAEMPATWEQFLWPDWVPAAICASIENFWQPRWGRGPKQWLRDAITQGGPALWSNATLRLLTQREEYISGRFVHLWNNIGCVVLHDGSCKRGSFAGSGVYTAVVNNGRGIDWVICGGESGPHARPMHPDWARALRDQCAAVGVPFFFKQWGEWKPASRHGYTGDDLKAGSIHRFSPETAVLRVGKKNAGRLLDGVEHNAFPKASSA